MVKLVVICMEKYNNYCYVVLCDTGSNLWISFLLFRAYICGVFRMLRRAIVSSSRVCTRLLSTIPSASVPGVDVEPSADVLRKASVRPILLK